MNWIHSETGQYTCSSTWNEICNRKPKDEWCKMFWLPDDIPSVHIQYIALYRIANWG